MKYIVVENIEHHAQALQFVCAFNAYHRSKAHQSEIIALQPVKQTPLFKFRQASTSSSNNDTSCDWCSTAFKLLDLWNLKKIGTLYICLNSKTYWFYAFHPDWAKNSMLPMYRRSLNVSEDVKKVIDDISDEESEFDYTNMGRYYPRLSQSSDELNHSQASSISGISQPRLSL